MRRPYGAAWRAAIALTLGGCTIELPPAPARRRGDLSDDVVAALTAGPATRDDVLAQFGEPERMREDGRVFVYLWRGPFAVQVFAPAGGGPARDEALVLRFDDAGRIERCGRVAPLAESETYDAFYARVEAWR